MITQEIVKEFFAVDRIQKWIKNGSQALPEEPTPDVEFEMVGDPDDWGSGDFDITWLGSGKGKDK